MAYSPGASSTYSNGGTVAKRGPCDEDHIREWPKDKPLENQTKNGDVFYERVCAVRKIGKGGFGEVYLGHRWVSLRGRQVQENCCIGDPWAIKVLESEGFLNGSPSSESSSVAAKEDRIQRELDVHNLLKDNPNIVTPKKTLSLRRPNGSKTYLLAMEYCQFGDLNRFLDSEVGGRQISETLGRDIIEQVVLGLKALRSKGFFHRDVKASNIFVTKHRQFKIGDFGLVAAMHEQNRIVCGTPSAMAPEMDGYNVYGPKVDIWSLGILLYSLLVGTHPFFGKSHEDTRRKSRSELLSFPHGSVSQLGQDLLSKMLCKDPRQRIDLEEVVRHPFITPKFYQEKTQSDSGFLTTSHLSAATNSSNTIMTQYKHRAPILQPLMEISGTYKAYGQCREQKPGGTPQPVQNQPIRPPSKATIHLTSSAPSLSHIDPVQYHGSAMPSSCQSRISTLNPPLSTNRLRPSSKVHKFKGGSVVIRPDACVHMEFSKTKEVIQNGMTTSVCARELFTISSDGQTIEVQKGVGKEAVRKSYSYAELPTKYWSKYNYAAKFVSITREQTPKITLYTDKVVCRLMENEPEPNCEVCFYSNGPRFSFSPCKGVRITRPSTLSKVEHFSAQTLSLDPSHELAYEWRVFREAHERILRLEAQLQQIETDELKSEGGGKNSIFPITLGKRPTSLSGS